MSIVNAQALDPTALEEVETHTTVTLANLPTELQHDIFLYLHPLDVISVGLTCRALFHSTNDRLLWIKLRRQVDIANRIFMCDKHDDISLRKLKHAATGPARMLRRLKQAQSPELREDITASSLPIDDSSVSSITPIRTTMFKPKPRSRITKETSCLYLIPGGRLLVTSICDRLSIWDLEVSESPSLLASKACTPGFIFLITPSKDQSSFNIAASIDDCEVDTAQLQIHTYSSSRPNVLRTTKTQLEVERDYDISVFTLIHNLFAYLHEGKIHIWNYVHNTFSSWNVPAPFDSQEFPEMFIYEERQIVIIGERFIAGWNIPPLVAQKVYQSKRGITLLGTVQPLFLIDLSTTFNSDAVGVDTPIRPAFVEKAHDWYTVFSPPQLFDIVWTTGDGKYDYFTTIDLEESGQSNAPFIAKLGPTIKVRSLADPYSTELDGDRCLEAWRVCESELVKGHHRRDGRLFELILSSSYCQSRSMVTRLGSFALGEDLRRTENLDRFRFSFDAVSGRACYMSRRHQKVVVVDYIGMDQKPVYDDDDREFVENIGLISLDD